ncbi:MAG: putative murein peptide carboxypeptidase [Myxococcota bacterium]|nr:putative murein peptide carboxypeptidase [Myxococcota bacterium]
MIRGIHILAASGPVPEGGLEAAQRDLASLRLPVAVKPSCSMKKGYLAADDGVRLDELQASLRAPEPLTIWCARGGYGLMRLLPRLEEEDFSHGFKLVAGFSDVTALHAALNARGWPSLHGPLATSYAREPGDSQRRMIRYLRWKDPGPIAWTPGVNTLKSTIEGKIYGGNLTVLCHLVGTPFLPGLTGAILFIEDVNEEPYRVDRMLTHLMLAGLLQRCAAVIVGAFTHCEPKNPEHPPVHEVIAERLTAAGVPFATGFPAGHLSGNLAFPLGVTARLSSSGMIEFPGWRPDEFSAGYPAS